MSKRKLSPPSPFVFMDLHSRCLSSDEKKFLTHHLLAGIVLFARNYESPEQLAQLIAEVRAINPHLLFAVDQEGGRVQRFKEPFTRLPAMKQLGDLYLLDENKGVELAKNCAWLVGHELAAFGIQINFAPVLDLDLGCNEVIGDRAFGGLASIVTPLGKAYIEGLAMAHVLPVAKHFPGHGGVNLDSHIAQPIDERSLDVLWEGDMKPFRDLMAYMPALMVSHVIYSEVSPMPAGYCMIWLNEILRQRMHSKALVFSDCLSMKAAHVAGDATKRIRLAYESGCNYVLLCNHPESQWDVLEKLENELLSQETIRPLATFQSPMEIPMSAEEMLQRWKKLQASEKYQAIRQELERLRAGHHVST